MDATGQDALIQTTPAYTRINVNVTQTMMSKKKFEGQPDEDDLHPSNIADIQTRRNISGVCEPHLH